MVLAFPYLSTGLIKTFQLVQVPNHSDRQQRERSCGNAATTEPGIQTPLLLLEGALEER
jgi:hypothetical protein